MKNETRQYTTSEEAKLVKQVIETFIKTVKLFKMYPSNNPIYVNASETAYKKLREFLHHENTMSLHISQYKIMYKDEEVYQNQEKEDNIALFMFKDGVRELTFIRGILQDELDDFLRILTVDFEQEAPDDDIVTILWQKDFEHIRYVADDIFLSDDEMLDEKRDYEKLQERIYTETSIQRAYLESHEAEIQRTFTPTLIDETDLQNIGVGISSLKTPRTGKLATILFELLALTTEAEAFRQVTVYLRNLLEYCVRQGDFHNAVDILDIIKQSIQDREWPENRIKNLVFVYAAINTSSFIKIVGDVVESSIKIEETEYMRYIRHMGKNSIHALTQLLAEAESIKGRHLLCEALATIGHLDTRSVAMGLKKSTWNVVRDTISVLGRIGSKEAFEHLKTMVSHPDERIRREVIRTIGSIKSPDTSLYLSKAIHDRDSAVRMTAVRALGNIRTEEVKQMLLAAISAKNFNTRSFNEKKEVYGTIALWKDNNIRDFLTYIIKKKKYFKRSLHDETKACAALAMGIMMDRDSIPVLEKASHAKNRVLRESALAALKKITS